MRKKRYNYPPEEKVFILKRHLIDRVAVPDLRDEYRLQPKVFYEWQKKFFKNGATAYGRNERSRKRAEEAKTTTNQPSMQQSKGSGIF